VPVFLIEPSEHAAKFSSSQIGGAWVNALASQLGTAPLLKNISTRSAASCFTGSGTAGLLAIRVCQSLIAPVGPDWLSIGR
jgi:hypothetical protein